jgi:hypothetical protein
VAAQDAVERGADCCSEHRRKWLGGRPSRGSWGNFC